jgi:hypothetical protein
MAENQAEFAKTSVEYQNRIQQLEQQLEQREKRGKELLVMYGDVKTQLDAQRRRAPRPSAS